MARGAKVVIGHCAACGNIYCICEDCKDGRKSVSVCKKCEEGLGG